MHNAIKKKIVAVAAVIILAFQFVVQSCSPVYSCLTQNPKQLYYAICFHLEHDSDKSYCGRINSVMAGFQGYANLKPLPIAVNLKNEVTYCWIDIWGYIQKKMGIIYFPGISEDVVYLNNGHLVFLISSSSYFDDISYSDNIHFDKTSSEITSETYCEKYKEVYQYLSDKDIEILYIAFPYHLHPRTVLPHGLKENTNQISSDRIKILKENGMPVIDAKELFKDSPDVHYQLFYKGDHHWKPEYAYKVYIYISHELEKQHSSMVKYFNRENMDWNDYYFEERWPPFHRYLGSGVQRVGRLYLPERDITPYMIPRKETNFTFRIPSKDINKTGSINDTFLEYFHDVPIEIIINNRVNNKNKIMVFKNSFMHSFAPFLATNNHCVYMIDLRHFRGNVIDLIDQEKPDAVFFGYHNWAYYSHIERLAQQIQEKKQKLNKTKKND